MKPILTDILHGAVLGLLVVGLIAPRFVLPRRFATRRGAALLYGAVLAGLILHAELGRLGLLISLVPLGVAWYLLKRQEEVVYTQAESLPVPEAESTAPPAGAGQPAPLPAGLVVPPAPGAPVKTALPAPPARHAGRRLEPEAQRYRWIPPGEPVTVGGFSLTCGMIYVGQDLPSIRPWGGPEPALIDPALRVGTGADATAPLGYWPSYTDLAPAARARYLRWLANGREEAGIDIGYVFLFFYGLERRLLHEGVMVQDGPERAAILQELDRLLRRYGENNSFRNYCRSLLSIAPLATWSPDATRRAEPPAELLEDGPAAPFQLRLRLGELVAAGQPINAGWALAWCLNSQDIPLRTPARRCLSEFQRLFRALYEREHGDGIIIKPNKTLLRFEYRPASASFPGPVVFTPEPGVPDVTILQGPTRKLQDLAERCMTALEPYSRWLGRNPDGCDDLAGLALLPPELLAARTHAPIVQMTAWLEEKLGGAATVTLPATELIDRWCSEKPETLGKAGSAAACSLLDKLAFGLEPDVRFAGPSLSRETTAVLFRRPPDAPSAPSPAYQGATILLHLAALVIAADDSVDPAEERRLEERLEQVLQLSPGERTRLRARLRWLLENKPTMAGLRKRLEALSADHRRSFAEFLIGVAGADGRISPEEVDLLRRLYPLLGLDPDDLYGHIHALAAGGGEPLPPPSGPVSVRPGAPVASGHRIPPQPAAPGPPAGGRPLQPITVGQAILLDQAKVESKLAETAIVAALLGSVFVDEESAAPSPAPQPSALQAAGDHIATLDAAHSSLLRALGERDRWSRADIEALAERHGLLPDGALETINEAAFEAVGEALLDGDDPIELNLELWKELVG